MLGDPYHTSPLGKSHSVAHVPVWINSGCASVLKTKVSCAHTLKSIAAAYETISGTYQAHDIWRSEGEIQVLEHLGEPKAVKRIQRSATLVSRRTPKP